MKNLQQSHNKTYSIGTSGFSYMVFAIVTVLMVYVTMYFAPSVINNIWKIFVLSILYIAFLLFLYLKGEKVIVTKNALHIKGWFLSKEILIKDIDSYKVNSSFYTRGEKAISIYLKNKKTITINAVPNKDFEEFITWLETEIEKKVELKIDPLLKQILQPATSFSSPNLNEDVPLKTYKVGKSALKAYVTFFISLTLLTIPVIISVQNNNTNHSKIMYIQTGGVIFLMIVYIIYAMFITNKLIISKNALTIKGLFLNRKLKFNEIKGYKTVYQLDSNIFSHIVIIPINKAHKKIIIRPTSKSSFIDLTVWIEKNIPVITD